MEKSAFYCTLQFLHCDWFLLPLFSAGHCGVMDRWLDTHARRRGFKPSPANVQRKKKREGRKERRGEEEKEQVLEVVHPGELSEDLSQLLFQRNLT